MTPPSSSVGLAMPFPNDTKTNHSTPTAPAQLHHSEPAISAGRLETNDAREGSGATAAAAAAVLPSNNNGTVLPAASSSVGNSKNNRTNTNMAALMMDLLCQAVDARCSNGINTNNNKDAIAANTDPPAAAVAANTTPNDNAKNDNTIVEPVEEHSTSMIVNATVEQENSNNKGKDGGDKKDSPNKSSSSNISSNNSRNNPNQTSNHSGGVGGANKKGPNKSPVQASNTTIATKGTTIITTGSSTPSASLLATGSSVSPLPRAKRPKRMQQEIRDFHSASGSPSGCSSSNTTGTNENTTTTTTTTTATSCHTNTSNGRKPQSAYTNGQPCFTHAPTLDELQKSTFSNYVRRTVLAAASTTTLPNSSGGTFGDARNGHDDDNDNNNDDELLELRHGMAKVRLPAGFLETKEGCGYGTDRTGRGPAWDNGTRLGDLVLHNPIRQNIRGMTGVYEYSHTTLPSPLTLAEFRTKADQYRTVQLGSATLIPVDIKKNTTTSNSNNATKHETDRKKTPIKTTNNKPSNTANNGNDCKNRDDDDASVNQVESTAAVEAGADSNRKSENSNAIMETETLDSDDASQQLDDVELTPEQISSLERQFWKQLSPTMPPAIYGADEPGTLFGDDPANGWSLASLDSCLHVLPDIPGVTSPYLYAGMWATVFCAHTEDMNLLSINYLHAGLPKLWYAVAEPDAARFASLAEHHFVHQLKECKEFLRHKRCLLSPAVLKKSGIRYQTAIQYPGDAIITFPGAYHFGFNAGFNVAEATNFGVPEWLPFGRRAKICLCRPDSVRIDMNRLTVLLQRYQKDTKRNRRLTWKEWRKRQDRKDSVPSVSSIQETVDEIVEVIAYSPKRRKRTKLDRLSEQQVKNEFWIEVMRPSELTKAAAAAKKKFGSKKVRPENPWHLAKQVGRKRLGLHAKVLCLVPAPPTRSIPIVVEPTDQDVSSDEEIAEEDNEYCLAGNVVEIADGHVLVHFHSMPKSEDKWISRSSPKLFLDGGQWGEGETDDMPALHYWKETDSTMLSL